MTPHLRMRAGMASLLMVILCGIAAPAWAHQTAMSTLNVEIRPDERKVDMLLAVSPADLGTYLDLDPNDDGFLAQSEIPQVKPKMAAYIGPKLRVDNNGTYCEPTFEDFVETTRRMSAVLFRETAICDQPLGDVTLTNKVMLDAPKGYTHYGQIQLGKDVHTTVFTKDTPTYTVHVADGGDKMAEQSFWEVFGDYTWQGVLHILLGIDHVLFVICLLMAAGEFRRLLKVITSFTLAHSITLALSALDVVTIPPSVVEPLIALSIAWVAVELLYTQRRRQRARDDAGDADGSIHGKHLFVLTFLFGLLHGFGFSYVLRDEVGLPTDALAPALFSFNVGVELGQIAVVSAVYPLVVWVRKRDWGWRVVQAVSAVVLAVSLYWFVARLV